MHRASWLVVALLFAPGGAAFARYVSLTAPAGHSAGGGPGGSYAAAAGAISNAQASSAFTNSVTKIPAGMRYTAAASRIAARALSASPLGLAGAAALWFASECISVQGGSFVLTCGGSTPPQSDGSQYGVGVQPNPVSGWHGTRAAACQAWVAQYPMPNNGATRFQINATSPSCQFQAFDAQNVNKGNFNNAYIVRAAVNCPVGWYITPAGCVQTPPPQVLTPQEVEDKMAPKPLPDAVPQQIPNVPLPIELPIWLPHIVPLGDPVPVPGTNPQTYKQPGIKLTPSPAVGDPWRADATPVDTPTSSPDPVSGPQPIPGSGLPQPVPDETPSMCEENPGILACEKLKLGELSADPIKNTNVPLAINADSGFPSGGACPAPKTHVLMGRSFQFSVQPICDFATMIRPLLIGFAWLAAAMTFLGVARREN